jgi:lipid-binding SYLF domain-containing protein
MKKTIRNAALLAALFVMATSSQIVRAQDLMSDAQQTIISFKEKDPTLQRFFDTAAGYAVFPTVAKGGLIVGGAHGDGVVYQNGTPIGTASLTQGTFGAQVGGQTYSEIIFFQTPAALQTFKDGKFAMSAEVNAVAATSGAGATAPYQQGVAVFTMARSGLMAAATVGGQKFSFKPLAAQPGQ